MGEATSSQEEVRSVLPSQCTIETIETVAESFREQAISGSARLTVDASAVEYVSTPGVQLLASLHKTQSAAGGQLVIEGAGSALRNAVTTLGLTDILLNDEADDE